jgi:hypothetical protein
MENSMNRMLMTAVCALAVLTSSAMLWGHDERLHGANALTGQITAVNANWIDLKVRTGTVKVRFSSRTKFERDKKAADRSHLKVGDHAGVVGNKLPNGDWMANEVILGLPAPNPGGSGKSATQKETDHEH